ncbi:MAG: SxtJ family membrane protein, partial [Pseudomonadota bacterium]
MKRGLHEDLGREEHVGPGSERSFGFVMAVAIPALTLLFFRSGWLYGLAVGGAFALVALVLPRALAPLNRGWHAFGLFLGRIVAPLIMGLIFFAVVTPIGLARRALGKRSLDDCFDAEAASYWVDREPPGPEPEQLPR